MRKIAEHDMAKVEYSFPVDKIHGKVAKSHKIGFSHRKQSKRNFTVEYGKRSTPVSASEVAHRTKFATCCANTRARMIDPVQLPADQAAYALVKNQYPSLYAYVFNQEWALL